MPRRCQKRKMGCCYTATVVRFSDENSQVRVWSNKDHFYRDFIEPTIENNYRLQALEDVMKKNDLLFSNEQLTFSSNPSKHIRLGEVETIARDLKILKEGEHLMIIH